MWLLCLKNRQKQGATKKLVLSPGIGCPGNYLSSQLPGKPIRVALFERTRVSYGGTWRDPLRSKSPPFLADLAFLWEPATSTPRKQLPNRLAFPIFGGIEGAPLNIESRFWRNTHGGENGGMQV